MSKDPITVEERISALESWLAYYKLMQAQGTDPIEEFNGKYKEQALVEVLAERCPKVPVTFDEGVDKNVKVKKFTIQEAPHAKAFGYLGKTARVFLECSDKGIHVTAQP